MTRTRTPIAARSTKTPRNQKHLPPPGEVLTLEEAATYLRVPAEDVVRMVAAQGLPGRQFGSEWRFFRAALQHWLSAPPRPTGLLAQLGKAKDDPFLEEMLAEIYARRGRPETEDG